MQSLYVTTFEKYIQTYKMMTSFMDEFRFLDKSDPDLLICGRHEYCHKVLLKAVFNILVKSFHNETFF